MRATRLKELKYLWDMQVYEYSTLEQAAKAGKRLVGLKWIDTNKGDAANPNVRARLVCTEVRRRGAEAIFSATPPLEALRMLIAVAAAEDPRGQKSPLRIGLYDVSRAYFYADAVRDVFIKLPSGDPRAGEAGVCGKLKKTMYGSLDAAEQWAVHYTKVLTAAGFEQGRASPCLFVHKAREIRLLVHGVLVDMASSSSSGN